MNCTPKNKRDETAKDEIANTDDSPNVEKSSADVWQRDIETRDYYYDDSHGYEVYNPEEDEETDEN